jgi:hypothetical protein
MRLDMIPLLEQKGNASSLLGMTNENIRKPQVRPAGVEYALRGGMPLGSYVSAHALPNLLVTCAIKLNKLMFASIRYFQLAVHSF